MATKQRSSRKFTIRPADNGDILEIGPGGTSQDGGRMIVQFIPDGAYAGSIVMMDHVFGPAAADADAPFMPIPYRRVTVNNVASDRTLVADPITGATRIEVPSNGVTIGLLVSCTAGSCTVVSWDIQGSFAD